GGPDFQIGVLFEGRQRPLPTTETLIMISKKSPNPIDEDVGRREFGQANRQRTKLNAGSGTNGATESSHEWISGAEQCEFIRGTESRANLRDLKSVWWVSILKCGRSS